MTRYRRSLRVRRYLDNEFVDERELDAETTDVLGTEDAAWSLEQTAAGRRWRIVIDDPAGDIAGALVVEGG